MKNEVTGKAIASLAGRILKVLEELPEDAVVWCYDKHGQPLMLKAKEVKAVVASALTQTKDKKVKKK